MSQLVLRRSRQPQYQQPGAWLAWLGAGCAVTSVGPMLPAHKALSSQSVEPGGWEGTAGACFG
jgi:hypothetical protein